MKKILYTLALLVGMFGHAQEFDFACSDQTKTSVTITLDHNTVQEGSISSITVDGVEIGTDNNATTMLSAGTYQVAIFNFSPSGGYSFEIIVTAEDVTNGSVQFTYDPRELESNRLTKT